MAFLTVASLNLQLESELTTSIIRVHEPEQAKASIARQEGIVFLVVWIFNPHDLRKWASREKKEEKGLVPNGGGL